MLSDPALQDWLTQQQLQVIGTETVSGGCVASCYKLTLSDGRVCFLKQQRGADSAQFAAEAAGLEALGQTGGLKTPQVLWHSADSLVLEYLAPAERTADFMQRLGEGLAQQHAQPSEQFGFVCDTWCGATRQPNTLTQDEYRFFAEQRLLYLGNICVDKALLSTVDLNRLEDLCTRLSDLIPEHAPVLLHGDLWSGNVHTGPNGEPVLIDPAVYQGWPESELAMTLLFGGFDPAFYRAYEANANILPDWRDRAALYNLWHLLNHLSLFGRSYQYEVTEILRRYAG